MIVLMLIPSGPCLGCPGLNLFGRGHNCAYSINSPVLKTKRLRYSFIYLSFQFIT